MSSNKNWEAIEVLAPEVPREISLSEVADASFSSRPPAFFEYLLRCLMAPFRLYSVVDGRNRMGHFAICILRGQARIAGVWLREPSHEAWAAAYFLAQQDVLRFKGAYELVAVGSEGPSQAGAAQAGFRLCPAPAFTCSTKKETSAPPRFSVSALR